MQSVLRVTVLVFLALASETVQQSQQQPEVSLSVGSLRGTILKSQHGLDFLSFQGIPYAKPPLGELRFAAPQEAEPWNSTLNALLSGPICPQPGDPSIMSEDCLTINVHTTNLTGNLPVIVYIHGGANYFGSGNSELEAGPQYLMDHDIVYVSFNYRLGALGFLKAGGPDSTGNYGYLDQVLALKWVQKHIANFGGDPQQVTLLGFSAGSMAVSLHVASPLSRGLFHKTIMMSGAATSQNYIDNLSWTRTLARSLNCPLYNPKDVVDCLRGVSWEQIINVTNNWETYGLITMKWNWEIDNKFLYENPTKTFLEGKYSKVPMMLGLTESEFDLVIYAQQNNAGLLNDVSLNLEKYAPGFFGYDPALEQPRQVSTKLRAHYLGNTKTPITNGNLDKFGRIFGDSNIRHGVHQFLNVIDPKQKVYFYNNKYKGLRGSIYGVPNAIGHGDELQYVFTGTTGFPQLPLDSPDMFMVDRYTKLLTSFATTGVPVWGDDATIWVPTTGKEEKPFIIDRVAQMGKMNNTADMKLWDELFPLTDYTKSLKKIRLL